MKVILGDVPFKQTAVEPVIVAVATGLTATILLTVIEQPTEIAGAAVLQVLALLLVTVCTPLASVRSVDAVWVNNKAFVLAILVNGKLGTMILD